MMHMNIKLHFTHGFAAGSEKRVKWWAPFYENHGIQVHSFVRVEGTPIDFNHYRMMADSIPSAVRDSRPYVCLSNDTRV